MISMKMGNKYVGSFQLNAELMQTGHHGLEALLAIEPRIYDHAPISIPDNVGIEVS